MKTILALFALAALSACAPHGPSPKGAVARVAVGDTRQKVASVKASTAATKASTVAVGEGIRRAEVQADNVVHHFGELRASLVEVERAPGAMTIARAKLAERQARTAAEAVQAQLVSVRRDSDLAIGQAQIADFKAAEAEASAAQAEQRVEALVQVEAKQARALQESERKQAEQRALAWKWRLLTMGSWALVVGFFIARQYLPILKFL